MRVRMVDVDLWSGPVREALQRTQQGRRVHTHHWGEQVFNTFHHTHASVCQFRTHLEVVFEMPQDGLCTPQQVPVCSTGMRNQQCGNTETHRVRRRASARKKPM